MITSPERLSVEAGRVIYDSGQRADCAYVILEGTVELTGLGTAGAVLVRGPGDVFGDLALVQETTRQATAIARTPCTVLAFSGAHISDRLEEVDPLLRIALGAIVRRYSDVAARTHPQGSEPHLLPFWDTHSAAAQRLLAFEHELRSGLLRGEMELFFQPIVRLSNGSLAGMEALVRWRHPRRGLLSPGDFIGMAEACGAIGDITTHCLRGVAAAHTTLQAAAAANGASVERLFISVNVSGLDLARPAFAAETVSIMLDAGVEPENIRLEVTESILMQDAVRCAATLQNCRDQGMGIAIDDFGTGYSSLHTLSALPISVLKMDRSFCSELLSEAAGRKITNTILHLGRELGLTVVSEGIETAAQCALLRAMGCELGQGFLFGAPASLAETIALVTGWSSGFVPAGEEAA